MNSNINILGVYYVNPCFSGALDKINWSKEHALKAAGEILCVCCAPWRLGAELRAHWGPALPSRSCCHGTLKFCHHVEKPCSAIALQGYTWKTSFLPVLVQRQGNSSMAELGCASPLHPPGTAWHGWMTSKPSLWAGANIWGGSSLALANTLRFLRLVDNDLSRQRDLGADKPRDLCIVYKYLTWPSQLTWEVMLELCPGETPFLVV